MPLFSSEVFKPLVFLGVHFLFVKHSASFLLGVFVWIVHQFTQCLIQ
jgi:hypothetical protein